MIHLIILLSLQFMLGTGFGLAIGWRKWKWVKKYPFPAPSNFMVFPKAPKKFRR